MVFVFQKMKCFPYNACMQLVSFCKRKKKQVIEHKTRKYTWRHSYPIPWCSVTIRSAAFFRHHLRSNSARSDTIVISLKYHPDARKVALSLSVYVSLQNVQFICQCLRRDRRKALCQP